MVKKLTDIEPEIELPTNNESPEELFEIELMYNTYLFGKFGK